ncbi:NAD(P)H-dependent oxidoreductase [Agrilactobacillus yilanensis]|nr:NAD(P)H-dependent oxidoreductase [Agrilactobacillus yilanensis]
MKTIIYVHPYAGSFNHAILESLTTYFTSNQTPYVVIDLYRDNFEPGYTAPELREYSKGTTPYPLVHNYQEKIAASDELIFITPIWWYNIPAELKGFFDKVMLKNFAYIEEPEWQGKLTYIKHATVITTATMTKKYIEQEAGDPIQRNLIDRVFTDIGITPDRSTWLHFGEVNLTTDQVRQSFLERIPKLYEQGKEN